MKHSDHSWLDRAEYPFTAHCITHGDTRQHYIDEGKGAVLLFVHGTPSWSFDFRQQIRHFSQTHRCIALDHVGFGLSDKPANADYSLQAHVQRFCALIEALDLGDITLVVHDFGGPIGFAAALQMPGRIRGIVVLNSWLWSSKGDPGFEKFAKILRSPLLPFLYRRLNFSPRFLLPSSFGDKKLPRKLLRQYTRPFSRASERNGALAFARALLHEQDWFQSLWERRAVLADKPMLLIWGMKDMFVGAKYLEGFQAGFPKAKALRLEGCGHFPQEEAADAVIAAMTDFLG